MHYFFEEGASVIYRFIKGILPWETVEIEASSDINEEWDVRSYTNYKYMVLLYIYTTEWGKVKEEHGLPEGLYCKFPHLFAKGQKLLVSLIIICYFIRHITNIFMFCRNRMIIIIHMCLTNGFSGKCVVLPIRNITI